MKNYFSDMMSDGYDLFVAEKIYWPVELEDSQKIKLLESAIEYFCEKEDYMKCAVLQKRIEEIQNPTPKRKRTTRKSKSIKTDIKN